MSELEVRMERLAPMRMACFQALGQSPEEEAWAKLRAWAEPRGLLKDTAAHPVFGYNDPSPSRPGEKYGYAFWIRIGPEMLVESGIATLDFPGGWYAVTTCRGFPNPDLWMRLLGWVHSSAHRHRPTHDLERPHDPLAPESETIFDLYLPVEDPAKARVGKPPEEHHET